MNVVLIDSEPKEHTNYLRLPLWTFDEKLSGKILPKLSIFTKLSEKLAKFSGKTQFSDATRAYFGIVIAAMGSANSNFVIKPQK